MDPGHDSAVSVARAAGSGIFLGASSSGPVFARPEDGVLALGPPRSGKTSSIVIPNLLCAPGPVVVASTKADVMAATIGPRMDLGPCQVFDPSGSVPLPPWAERASWSPLLASTSWSEAVLVADAMVRAARPGTERGDAAHWSERAGALLATVLYAGALEEMPMRELVGLVDRHDPATTRVALARHGADRALDLLEGIVATDGREQSGIWSTTSGVLAAYRTDGALSSTEGPPLDLRQMMDENGTLYVLAPSDAQRHAAPVVAGLIRAARTVAYDGALRETIATSSQGPGRQSGHAPLLLALDELANIAPLHDLPTLVAEGGSQGVITLACLQDLSQARARWGQEADGFLSLFGTKLVFPGVGDIRTLEAISQLAGDHDVPTFSLSHPARWSRLVGSRAPATQTVSFRRERILPVDAIARGIPSHVLGIEGARPGMLRQTPYFTDEPWRGIVDRCRGPRFARSVLPGAIEARRADRQPPSLPSRQAAGPSMKGRLSAR